MKYKLITLLFLGMFLINSVYALEDLGTFKQGETVIISQICNDATYITLSSISKPDSTRISINENMTFVGSGEFNYNFSSTYDLGRYDVKGISDGCENTFAYYFTITPSGQGGTENITFFILIILLIYGITFTGFFGRNIPMTILGGMAMLFLGVYLVSQGIIIFRDDLTNYIAYLTIAVGAITSFWAVLEQFEVI